VGDDTCLQGCLGAATSDAIAEYTAGQSCVCESGCPTECAVECAEATTGGSTTGGSSTSGSTTGGSSTSGSSTTGGSSSTGGSTGGACAQVTLGQLQQGGYTNVWFSGLTPNVGNTDPDYGLVELYSSDPGTFDLASGVNADFATCEQCVLAYQDVDDAGAPGKYFFQKAGSLTVDSADLSAGAIQGSYSGVSLGEVALVNFADGGGDFQPVPGGSCLQLVNGSIAVGVTDAGSDPCDVCIDDAAGTGGTCEQTYDTCSADTACVDLSNCIQSCTANDSACEQACQTTAGTTATDEFFGYVDCVQSTCSTECGFDTDGGSVTDAGSGVPDGWTCLQSYYGDGYCDCGCGAFDALDCADANESSCGYCYANCGSFETDASSCAPYIDPTDNSQCAAASDGGSATDAGSGVPDGWMCPLSYYDDGSCDCGCGVMDIDCPSASADACEYCEGCNAGGSLSCSGSPVDPTDNSQCIGSTDGGSAGAGTVIFSEYFEGASNNKALEIANPTGGSVDLTGYAVKLYSNGSASVSSTYNFPDATVLAPGATYLLCNSQFSAALKPAACVSSGVAGFNGDDTLTLVNADGAVIDSFGDGTDPGSMWGSGDTSTVDHDLRRDCSVTHGVTPVPASFDPANYGWAGFVDTDVSNLGVYACP